MSDYNVLDQLKELSVPEVKEYCQRNTIPAAVAMGHLDGDFNFSQIVRTANFFGFEGVHYWGKKKWDRRGAVGTQNYTPITHYLSESDFFEFLVLHRGYTPIAIENNHNFEITEFQEVKWWEFERPVFIFGEEKNGLSEDALGMTLKFGGKIIEIPPEGSVRSLNVASTFAIIAATYNLFARYS